MAREFKLGYWENTFQIHADDLNRLKSQIDKCQCAIDTTELIKKILRGRLRYGEDPSQALYLPLNLRKEVHLWNPTGKWAVGDKVIVARDINDSLQPFLGEIVAIESDKNFVHIFLFDTNDTIRWQQCDPGSEKAERWQNAVYKAIRNKEERLLEDSSEDTESEEVELILLKFGDTILQKLLQAIKGDDRFLILRQRIFLKHLILPLEDQLIDQLHKIILSNSMGGEIITLDKMVELLQPELPAGDVGLFSLHQALCSGKYSHLFTNDGTDDAPKWKTIIPPPPEWNKAKSKYYVFDPNNYTILAQPNMPLSNESAKRLEELGYYRDTVEPI